jgi:dTDP-4-amino-4,6-dideoxygalactose transaminase
MSGPGLSRVWPPYIGARERLRPSELLTGLFHRGDGLRALEQMIPDRPWTFVSYGKSAFEMAVIDAGLAGSEILMPAFISHDYVGVFDRHRITPRFADVELETVQLDPSACPPDLLGSVTALVLLHSFGLPADGAGFRELADRHGLVMIEDCARALGGERDGHPVGWYGDYATYSLSKIAPVVRGGLLSSRRPVTSPTRTGGVSPGSFVHALFLLRPPGLRFIEGTLISRLRETPVYLNEVGLYEAPDIEGLEASARLVLDAFLPHYAEAIDKKRRNAATLMARLEPLGFTFQKNTGGHLYTALGARVPEGVDRDDLVRHVKSHNVNVFTLWGDPLGISPLARGRWGTDASAFPVTARLAAELIHFPNSRFHTEGELDRIVGACAEYLG